MQAGVPRVAAAHAAVRTHLMRYSWSCDPWQQASLSFSSSPETRVRVQRRTNVPCKCASKPEKALREKRQETQKTATSACSSSEETTCESKSKQPHRKPREDEKQNRRAICRGRTVTRAKIATAHESRLKNGQREPCETTNQQGPMIHLRYPNAQ